MSSHFQEFEELIAEPMFLEDDTFLRTQELTPLFDTQDWKTIRSSWQDKDEEYQSRLVFSLWNINHPEAIALAFDLFSTLNPANVSKGLSLLRSSRPASRYITEPQLEILAQVWQANPAQRDQIQQTLWAIGRSGQLRRLLGFDRWSDAPKPFQPAV